jgi:DNA-binding CsgD family transcriptional regulator
MEPLYGMSAQLALLRERPDEARGLAAEGLRALEGSEEGARTARMIWHGLRAEADAAERDAALGEALDEARIAVLEAALAAAEALPAMWAEGPLYAALARAEGARARHAAGGPPDAAAFGAAADGFAALSLPWPAAYARFRAAEAHVQAGDRSAATGPLTAARADAAAMGAAPLLGEIDALARRARVDVAPREPAAAEPVRDDSPIARLGLTPREREVLELLAEGRTNREIGAALYMSEKTASVHVSRILAKLGVGGRVEAAAVAYRLGMAAPERV